jgi:hypothetical protein
MRLEIAALGERAGTLLTLIWSLARVSPDVNFKSTRSHERHLTEAAFEWPLTSMPSLVVTEMSMSREDSTAVLECACKWLLAVVDAQVRLEVALLGESLFAARPRTWEGFDAGVHSEMNLEAASTRVRLAAVLTDEGLVTCVDQLMGLQVALCNESLATPVIGANVRSLTGL